MPGAGAVHHIKAGLEFPRLALFRLTRREKVVEPPKDRSADDAIHQRIDRPGNDRAHAGARTVTREDGPAQLKKRLPPGSRSTDSIMCRLGSRSSAPRRKGDMGWPSHPIAICTACGAPIEDPRFINDRCARRVDGRRCNGTYGITMSPRDWKRCGSCSGLGFRGDRRCNLCWGTGWAYVGEKNY